MGLGRLHIWMLFCVCFSLLAIRAEATPPVESSPLADQVRARQLGTPENPGPLLRALVQKKLQPGDRVFLRIFKQTDGPLAQGLTPEGKGILEFWMASPGSRYELFKTYPIAKYSGALGPKLKEGDYQSPEGFYAVTPELMNPFSSNYLAMNVGYPNEYDSQNGRTGSFIMIHGGNKSVGCFAMTDPGIEEIYVLSEAALNQGQAQVGVHSFPFPLNELNLGKAATLPWLSFWQNLAEGFNFFENDLLPPFVQARGGRYYFSHGAIDR